MPQSVLVVMAIGCAVSTDCSLPAFVGLALSVSEDFGAASVELLDGRRNIAYLLAGIGLCWT